MLSNSAKLFLESVNMWQSYRQFTGGNFFETQCRMFCDPPHRKSARCWITCAFQRTVPCCMPNYNVSSILRVLSYYVIVDAFVVNCWRCNCCIILHIPCHFCSYIIVIRSNC